MSARVILGDDHAMVLNGIRAALDGIFEVVGSAPDGRQLVELAQTLKPDVVVLDVSMPLLNGLDAAKQIKAALPTIKIIFLTMHANPGYLRRALDVGALGYVLKTGLADELLEAIEAALEGKLFLSPGFGTDVLETRLDSSGRAMQKGTELTDRQREILQLVAEGRANKEIAHVLGISIKTVDFHRGRISTKLGARSTAELTRIAIEQGLIALTDTP